MRGSARIYDVRMAQFGLKIEKLSHIMEVRADFKTYGLHPRLWLLVLNDFEYTRFAFEAHENI